MKPISYQAWLSYNPAFFHIRGTWGRIRREIGIHMDSKRPKPFSFTFHQSWRHPLHRVNAVTSIWDLDRIWTLSLRLMHCSLSAKFFLKFSAFFINFGISCGSFVVLWEYECIHHLHVAWWGSVLCVTSCHIRDGTVRRTGPNFGTGLLWSG